MWDDSRERSLTPKAVPIILGLMIVPHASWNNNFGIGRDGGAVRTRASYSLE